ncbi:MAG TPA: hypothetical protein EYG51_22065 [Pseudomonadales bacterium]|nr:hypothetical protein [Pseudomonadales bacterium]
MKIPKMQLRKMILEEKYRILQEQKRTVFDMLDGAISLFKRLDRAEDLGYQRSREVAEAMADLEIVKKEFQAEAGASGQRDYHKDQDSNLDWM